MRQGEESSHLQLLDLGGGGGERGGRGSASCLGREVLKAKSHLKASARLICILPL